MSRANGIDPFDLPSHNASPLKHEACPPRVLTKWRKTMDRKKHRTAIRVLLAGLLAIPFLLWSLSSSAVYDARKHDGRGEAKSKSAKLPNAPTMFLPMPPPKADLDQVRNGSFDAVIDPPSWVNGNAGASNAHYFEGQSIPYRVRLTNIALTTHVLEIEWDIKHSGVNAIDYITHYDRIAETVLPCLGVSGCNGGSFNTFAIPPPSSNGSPVPGQPTASFNALPAGEKVMTIYNGTIQSLTYVTQGDLNASQSATRLQINFTATSSTVVIAWGGHIAAAGDWGPGNSAGGISGSPYHSRLISFDGSGGNQDRSLSASAVQAPSPCQLSGPTVACESDGNAHYEVTNVDAGATYTWQLINNTSGATITNSNGNPANGAVFADVDPGGPGSYTVQATPSNAGGSGGSCSVTTSVQANTSTTDLQDGQSVCPGTNVNFSTTASGGDGNCSFSWTLDGNAIADTDNSVSIDTTSLSPGNHTVEVTVDCNCGPPAVQNATFEVKAPTSVTDEIDNAEACDGATNPVVFQVAAVGAGPLSYAWTLDGNPITDVDGDDTKLTVDASALAVGSHPVSVIVTGACNSDTSNANLVVNSNPTVTITLSQECDTISKLTATGGFDTYSWSGPTPVNDPSGTCGLNKSCLLIDKTGVYTVDITDSNSCAGSQTAQLCFSMTSPAPSAPVRASVTLPGSESNVPAPKRVVRDSLLARLTRVLLFPF